MNRRNLLKAALGTAVVGVTRPALSLAAEDDGPYLVASRDWGLEYMKDTTWKLYSEVRAYEFGEKAEAAFQSIVDDPQRSIGNVGSIKIRKVLGIRKDVELDLGEDYRYFICENIFELDVIVTYKFNMVYLFLIQADRQKDKNDCYEVIQDVVDRAPMKQTYYAEASFFGESILDVLPTEEDVAPLGLDQLDDERVYEPLN